MANSNVGGPSDRPFKEAGEAGVPPVGRTVGPTSKSGIGVIGGSGLYHMEGLSNVEEVQIQTPFGDPSDTYRIGVLEGRKVAFLARHNRNHSISPSELNFRANIYGFKQLGVEWILSASAVGSLKEELPPLDIVLPDQFFDRTKSRISTFFGNGVVVHISFADPICNVLADVVEAAGKDASVRVKRGGTYVCMWRTSRRTAKTRNASFAPPSNACR
jgi:5'-methylthioadenosine phosphorylase